MDERVKNTYEKIYAELFRLVLVGCCLSAMIKIALLDMPVTACIPEYPIMIGSPIYLLIRSRMLGVTQAAAAKPRYKRNMMLSLVCALLVSLFVAMMILRGREGTVEWNSLIGFAFSFIGCFLLVHFGVRKWEELRQRKLDERYDEDEGK